MPCMADFLQQLEVSTSESGNVVYALHVITYNQESQEEIDIVEYNECKRKQEEKEKRLAEQYGIPYKEENSIK